MCLTMMVYKVQDREKEMRIKGMKVDGFARVSH